MKQLINLGTGPNSGVGDTLYSGSVKINENFDELYETVGNAVTLDHIHSGTGINVVLTPGIATINNTAPNVQSDWNATSGLSAILNKPVLSSIAFSGSYNDLLDTPIMPTLSEVALSGDYNDLMNIPVFPQLATVATSGSYDDLLDKPNINDDRLVAGSFSVVLDGNTGILHVPDGINFTLGNTSNQIYGPGANHTLYILGGSSDAFSDVGGHIVVQAGDSIGTLTGTGGHTNIIAGFGEEIGGNILINAGSAGGGYGSASSLHSTGGTVTVKAGYGTGRGGSVIISSDTASVYNSSTEVVGVLNGDVVIETNRPAGHIWTYGADGTARCNHMVSQTSSVNCPAGVATEVYASWYYAPEPGVRAVSPGMKLFLSCTGNVTGDSSGEHVEASEVTVVRRPDSDTLVVNTYNRTFSSLTPLVLITASVDPVSSLVKVFCRPTDSANPVSVVMNSIEHFGYVFTGGVIV